MEINAAAKLDISPKGSQIAIVALFSFSALAFAAALWLDYVDKSYYLALIGSVAFLVFGSIGWWFSHRNEALAKSHPFTLNMGTGSQSVLITSDARSLPEATYLQSMLSYWSYLIYRHPLPEADGLVGADGVPIDNTKLRAKLITDEATSAADRQLADAVKALKERAAEVFSEPSSPVVAIIDPVSDSQK